MARKQDVATTKLSPTLSTIGLRFVPAAWETRFLDLRGHKQAQRVLIPRWDAGPWKQYEPETVTDLPQAFAAVHDEPSLRQFMNLYGPLGYTQMYDQRAGGDPISWALEHARAVAGILGCCGILASEYPAETLRPALRVEFRKMGYRIGETTKEPDARASARYMLEFLDVIWAPIATPGLDLDRLMVAFYRDWEIDPRRAGYMLIAHRVNPVLSGLRYKLVAADETPLGLRLKWSTLLEFIYLKVAGLIHGGNFRHCQRCTKLFPAHDPRTVYCSDSCRNIVSCRQYRERKKRKKPRSKRR